MKIGVKNLKKTYEGLSIFENLTVDFDQNQINCILGPSGCGKTTLLNILTGMIEYDAGELYGFEGKKISYVFQEDRLIEWKTVKENLEFVLKGKLDKEEIDKKINEYLETLNLLEYVDYYPGKLSGGMRQRIAVIRAYIYPSDILIMDEPFKSLDMDAKQNVMQALIHLREKEKRTTILVTHDIEEAKYLGCRIIELSEKPTKVLRVSEKRNA